VESQLDGFLGLVLFHVDQNKIRTNFVICSGVHIPYLATSDPRGWPVGRRSASSAWAMAMDLTMSGRDESSDGGMNSRYK
jgi:hypothetical protein